MKNKWQENALCKKKLSNIKQKIEKKIFHPNQTTCEWIKKGTIILAL